ncbi:hypothetical protein JTE90_022648 [Oedothorax gibbosus]|uniref:Uncharacterized protein n=1 Tax=Oedothorax gibbosus TaxID=931172 RepID=A0AAV6TTL0_9ARAC|nr:hypothetical protein JTE90_022648 [Oedothorax gibbosus]
MFDVERQRMPIAEFYFRLFRHRKEDARALYQRWIDLLIMYSQMPRFISFDPPVPLLHRLVPRAIAVVIVLFPKTRVPMNLRSISTFPLYPFRVNYTSHTECCSEGEEFLHMYLQSSGIRLVGVFSPTFQARFTHLLTNLEEKMPRIQCYGPSSFDSFRQVCRRRQRVKVT